MWSLLSIAPWRKEIGTTVKYTYVYNLIENKVNIRREVVCVKMTQVTG
jgi:hypothetical protein